MMIFGHLILLKKLILEIYDKPHAVTAFCTYVTIDPDEQITSKELNFNYSGSTAVQRIKKFMAYYDDGFFYGLHRTEI